MVCIFLLYKKNVIDDRLTNNDTKYRNYINQLNDNQFSENYDQYEIPTYDADNNNVNANPTNKLYIPKISNRDQHQNYGYSINSPRSNNKYPVLKSNRGNGKVYNYNTSTNRSNKQYIIRKSNKPAQVDGFDKDNNYKDSKNKKSYSCMEAQAQCRFCTKHDSFSSESPTCGCKF